MPVKRDAEQGAHVEAAGRSRVFPPPGPCWIRLGEGKVLTICLLENKKLEAASPYKITDALKHN